MNKSKDKLKDIWTFVFIPIILILTVYNAWDDAGQMKEHHDFFAQMQDFMRAGGRNTSSMGWKQCVRTNKLEFYVKGNDAKLNDCDDIYGVQK